MKKLSYLFVSLFIVAAIVSCQKTDSEQIVLKSNTVKTESSPAASVTPFIIPGDNNGGNRTCAEVEAAFNLPAGYFRCGEKIDYNDGYFAGDFPEGLIVTVSDGTYVTFEMKDCIEIDGRFFKVGAVIVKGGNAANVYYYEGGTLGDINLASPANKNGKPAGLSNLSFCFVECGQENPELVIALKTYLVKPSLGETPEEMYFGWAVSGGLGVSLDRGLHMGYNLYSYTEANEFDLVKATLDAIIGKIGTINARDYWAEGIHYLEVIIDTEDPSIFFGTTYLYVGSLEGYTGMDFKYFPFVMEEVADIRKFVIPFNEIVD